MLCTWQYKSGRKGIRLLTATSAQQNSPEFSSYKFLLNPPAAELLGPMKGNKPQQVKNKKTKEEEEEDDERE
jgi:hypothetical protein